ncbi:MAG: hypothetical protein ACTHLH_05295 [Solirubrobacterales bacterium]
MTTLIAAVAALVGAVIGALVARRSSREANELLAQQVAMLEESAEREHARFVAERTEDLHLLQREWVEIPIKEEWHKRLEGLEAKAHLLFCIKADATAASLRSDRQHVDRLVSNAAAPRKLAVPVLADLGSQYEHLPMDLGELLTALVPDVERYNELAAQGLNDDDLWRACARLNRGLEEAAKLATQTLPEVLSAIDKLRGEIRGTVLATEEGLQERLGALRASSRSAA